MSAISRPPAEQPTIMVRFPGTRKLTRSAAQPRFAVALRTVQQTAKLVWTYLQAGRDLPLLKRRHRRLRITETLSLGDKRSVSILEVDGQAFLVGSSGASIALLASLTPEPAPAFERMLRDSLQRDEAR